MWVSCKVTPPDWASFCWGLRGPWLYHLQLNLRDNSPGNKESRYCPDALNLYPQLIMPSAQWHSACTRPTGTRRAAAGCPISLRLSHGDLLHGNNHPIVSPIDGTPLATNRKICISISSFFFFQSSSCRLECVYLSAFVCKCECVWAREHKRKRESNSTYFNLHDCKYTKKAIEGIKDLVLSWTGI